MSASCDECGNDTFEDLEHHYYAGEWSFTCAECGATLRVREEMTED